ncbi:DUF7344 domain-containing protein [Halorarius litoreus]|uniref:DUF7344 domain-containing protein n=1 Tax=Halorarius litoreus TaxID=2962676 RepID=UPI0020CB732A|nr:hypothetical protein [Halorarius litoreus]
MEGETQPSRRATIDWDTTMSTLAATRRRYLLAALADSGGTATLTELSRRVIAAEEGGLSETVPDDRVDETVTALRHSHVPNLLGKGLVEWTDGREQLRLTSTALSNPVLLPLARWSRYPSPAPIPIDVPAQRERSRGD